MRLDFNLILVRKGAPLLILFYQLFSVKICRLGEFAYFCGYKRKGGYLDSFVQIVHCRKGRVKFSKYREKELEGGGCKSKGFEPLCALAVFAPKYFLEKLKFLA